MPKAGNEKRSLRDLIVGNLPKRKSVTFESTLPADVLAELQEIREDFRAGRMPGVTKTGLGKAISVSLAERGMTFHSLTVTRWLEA